MFYAQNFKGQFQYFATSVDCEKYDKHIQYHNV